MSIEEKNLAHASLEPVEELEDLQAWWKKNGNWITTLLLMLLVAILGYNVYERQVKAKQSKASLAFSGARSPEALEEVLANYPSSPVAPLALLSLGSENYHRQRYEQAMSAYTAFLRDYPKHELAPIAIVGIAHAAEAQGLNADAEVKFRDFAERYPEHYLTPLAILGQARCIALQERRDEARAILDRMMADRAGTPWSGHADELLAALPRLKGALPQPSFADALKSLESQLPSSGKAAESEAAVTPEVQAVDPEQAE